MTVAAEMACIRDRGQSQDLRARGCHMGDGGILAQVVAVPACSLFTERGS